MPYDEVLAARVRDSLEGIPGLTEQKMFGGIAFLLDGQMCCGISNDDLVLRLGTDGADEALGQPFTRPMDFTGRPLKGYVYVAPGGIATASRAERLAAPRGRVHRFPTAEADNSFAASPAVTAAS